MQSAPEFTKTSRSSSEDTIGPNKELRPPVDVDELVRKRDVYLKLILFNNLGACADYDANSEAQASLVQALEHNENAKLFQFVHGDLEPNRSVLQKFFDCFGQLPVAAVSQMFESIEGFAGKLVTVYLIVHALDELSSAESSASGQISSNVDAQLDSLSSLLLQLTENSKEFCLLLNRILAKPASSLNIATTATSRGKTTSLAFVELFKITDDELLKKRLNFYRNMIQVLLQQLFWLTDYNAENSSDISKRLVLSHRLKYDKNLQKWRIRLINTLVSVQDQSAEDDFNEDMDSYKSLDHNLFNWHLFLILVYLRQKDQISTSPRLQTSDEAQSDEDVSFNDYLRIIRFEKPETSSSTSAKTFWQFNKTIYRKKDDQDDDSIKEESMFKLKANLAVKFLLFLNEWYDVNAINKAAEEAVKSGSAETEDGIRFKNSKCYLLNLRQFFNLPMAIDMLHYLTYSDGASYEVVRVRYRLKLINLIINLLSYLIYRLKVLVRDLVALPKNPADSSDPVSASLRTIADFMNANKSANKKIRDFLLVTQYLIEMIQTFSNSSIKFSLKFHNKFLNNLKSKVDIKSLRFHEYGVECLFSFLNNDELCDFFRERILFVSKQIAGSKESSSAEAVSSLSRSLVDFFGSINTIYIGVLGAILNLSPCVDKFKKIWDENLDGLNTCIKISNKFGKINDYYRLCAYMVVANIANDKQLDELTETDQVIQSIVDLIVCCIAPLESGTAVTRQKIQINDDDDDVNEVLVTTGKKQIAPLASELSREGNAGNETESPESEYYSAFANDTLWNIIELLKALYKLSINDKIKADLYSKYSMRTHLKVLIFKGNEPEKEFTLGLMCQLSFNESIVQQILKDKELINYISSISKNENGQFKRARLVKNANNIMFLLSKYLDDGGASAADPTSAGGQHHRKESVLNLPPSYHPLGGDTPNDDQIEVIPSKRHIMISYNRDSRDLCLSIKTNLEKLGYKIWIDIQDIHGSSLESMANAIEESSLVLICMTQKYKLSANCRLEAEYTMNLSKPFVPLILQKDYKPDGWLGIILGTKMFVNYTKYEFSVCMEKLVAEIAQIHKDLDKAYYKSKNKVPPPHVIPPDKTSTEPTKPPSDNSDSDKPDKKPDDDKPKAKPATSWSVDEVSEWLKQRDFHKSILANLANCDGKLLHQIYRLHQQAPEFFFQTLRDTNQKEAILLKDLALFIFELEHLFSNA